MNIQRGLSDGDIFVGGSQAPYHFTATTASALTQWRLGFRFRNANCLPIASLAPSLDDHVGTFIATNSDNADPLVWAKTRRISAASKEPVSGSCN